MKIRKAKWRDRESIFSIGKQSHHTSGVSNPMFFGKHTIQRGEAAVAEHDGEIYGFVVVRHLVRKPFTSLYYVGVGSAARSRGLGELLVRWALRTSPHGRIRLICDIDNEKAHTFYERLGFQWTDTGMNKSGERYFVFMLEKDDWKGKSL